MCEEYLRTAVLPRSAVVDSFWDEQHIDTVRAEHMLYCKEEDHEKCDIEDTSLLYGSWTNLRDEYAPVYTPDIDGPFSAMYSTHDQLIRVLWSKNMIIEGGPFGDDGSGVNPDSDGHFRGYCLPWGFLKNDWVRDHEGKLFQAVGDRIVPMTRRRRSRLLLRDNLGLQVMAVWPRQGGGVRFYRRNGSQGAAAMKVDDMKKRHPGAITLFRPPDSFKDALLMYREWRKG